MTSSTCFPAAEAPGRRLRAGPVGGLEALREAAEAEGVEREHDHAVEDS